jgi:hypothetical protein
VTEVLETYRKEHTLLETFDDVLLPALAHAERDRENGDITEANQEFIWNTAEQFIDELSADTATENGDDAAEKQKTKLIVVGAPVLDRADELALKMLSRTVAPHIQINSLTTDMLTSELLARLEEAEPDVVCISALGPGGVGQVRYMCKRVRQSFPLLPILVGRWAFHGNADRMISNTKERGATNVVITLNAALDALSKQAPRVRPRTEPVEIGQLQT